jgi:gamma-D-glutamyl-L-lysine dipeptidyl-peptidase
MSCIRRSLKTYYNFVPYIFMKQIRLLSLLLILIVACSPTNREDILLSEIVHSVKETYAPDSRTAVFDIGWERWDGTLVLTGETDNPDLKDVLFTALGEAELPAFIDSITVLPHPELGEKHHAIVTVSVGNMRNAHRHTAELVTQVLLGTPVKVLKRHRGWYYIQSPDSYLGWINSGALHLMTTDELDDWQTAPKLIVTDHYGIVYEQPHTDALPVTNAVIGTRLLSSGQTGSWYRVTLPDGRIGYIEIHKAHDYAQWEETRILTGTTVTATAMKFLGVPYLWGGTSVKGFDCSGFTKTVFWLNGMDLYRDASQQVSMGIPIDAGENFSGLREGDLLFFGRAATERQPERIVHVGIYLGNGEFIHSSVYVRINSLFPEADNYDEFERNRYVRARRLIHRYTYIQQ